jgi:hypothetical protein
MAVKAGSFGLCARRDIAAITALQHERFAAKGRLSAGRVRSRPSQITRAASNDAAFFMSYISGEDRGQAVRRRCCRRRLRTLWRRGLRSGDRRVCEWARREGARVQASGAGGDGSASVRSARSREALSLWLTKRDALLPGSGIIYGAAGGARRLKVPGGGKRQAHYGPARDRAGGCPSRPADC